MPELLLGCQGESEIGAIPTAGKWTTAGFSDEGDLIETAVDLLSKLPVRGPLGVPKSSRRMHGKGEIHVLQLGPKWIVVRMCRVTILNKRRTQKNPTKTGNRGNPAQLFHGKINILQGNHSRRKQALRIGLAEIRYPVVIGPG